MDMVRYGEAWHSMVQHHIKAAYLGVFLPREDVLAVSQFSIDIRCFS
jgi:hypothetical protein